ncbi:hypothetical protein ACHAXS_012950 [Conticribra weissflogii]
MPSILSNLKSAREWATPTLKTSAFLTRGVLTPEEFVRAGDELVFQCPTWSWEGGDPKKRKNYLPKDKQFLVTRGVPCWGRVSSLEGGVALEDLGGEGGEGGEGDDGDWLVSRILTAEERMKREEEALVEEFDLLDDEGHILEKGVDKLALEERKGSNNRDSLETRQPTKVDNGESLSDGGNEKTDQQTGGNDEDDGEYEDMADFEDDNIMEDEAALPSPAPANDNDNSSSPSDTANKTNNTNSNTINLRTYDLSLTYDKYYQTPRVWLMGYSDDGSTTPLTGEEMMQDVISDYANRTVTIENHPHVSGPHASIHPCQHGKVMKVIVRNLTKEGEEGKDGGGPSVEMYLFIFLKFVSSMIPTINYDFTKEVSASTQK